jgi:hypothetical protein
MIILNLRMTFLVTVTVLCITVVAWGGLFGARLMLPILVAHTTLVVPAKATVPRARRIKVLEAAISECSVAEGSIMAFLRLDTNKDQVHSSTTTLLIRIHTLCNPVSLGPSILHDLNLHIPNPMSSQNIPTPNSKMPCQMRFYRIGPNSNNQLDRPWGAFWSNSKDVDP